MLNNSEHQTVENTSAGQVPAARNHNADAIIGDMIKSITRLHDVYHAETDALESANTKLFVELQQDKLVAAKDYQSQAQYVLRHKKDVVNAAQPLKEKLELLQSEFAEISERNNIALERMRRTTDRLSNNIRNAAKKAAQKKVAVNYGARGTMKSDDRKIISTGIIETA